MLTLKKIFLSLFLGNLLLSTFSHATDNISFNNEHEQNETHLFNSTQREENNNIYVRKGVLEQCKNYHTILDPLFNEARKERPEVKISVLWQTVRNMPAPGLLNILRDGFLIARNYINTKSLRYNPEVYIQNLEKEWDNALEESKKNNLNFLNFILINHNMAEIVSEYKNENSIKNYEYSIKEACLYPTFIIYAHPDENQKARGISIKTFLDQYIGNGEFPVWLVTFDVHSNIKAELNKSDAHHSHFNGTISLLVHDILHLPQSFQNEEEGNMYKYIKRGHSISQKLRNKESFEEAKILEEGLFLLFHETNNPIFKTIHGASEIDILKSAAKEYLSQTPTRLLKIPSLDDEKSLNMYKMFIRDSEIILKAKDKNGNSFLSTLTMDNGKQRALPLAKEVISFTDENSPYPAAKEIYKYHIIKTQDEFIPAKMTWAYSHKKISDLSIKKERNALLAPLVTDAFTRFWESFFDILDQNLF